METFVTTPDGARVWTSVDGDDFPLLLIPGLGSDSHVFRELVPLLCPSVQVVTFDPRGLGKSDLGTADYTIPQLADDAATVITGLGFTRVDVFGLSMGGMVALDVALNHAASVRSLVLGATSCSARLGVEPAPEVRMRLLGKGAHTPADAYRLACTVLYSQRFQDLRPNFIEAQVEFRGAHPVRGRVFTAQNAARNTYDSCGRLKELSMPTLVTHGTDDILVPLPNAQELARLIPGAQHYWFDGCGHLFFHEDPETTRDVVLSFLRSIPG